MCIRDSPGTETSLDNIDNATIAVPNDTTNEARALLLLQDNGYITLKDGVGLTATTKDIVENPHNITFVELEAAQVPRTLPEVSFGVLNGNYEMCIRDRGGAAVRGKIRQRR